MTATSTRHRLPNRRRSEAHDLELAGQRFTVTVSRFEDGAIGEVFIVGAKTGSAMDAVLADAGILASLALQHGTPPAALAKSMSRLPTDPWGPAREPASPVAAAMDMVAKLAADSDARAL